MTTPRRLGLMSGLLLMGLGGCAHNLASVDPPTLGTVVCPDEGPSPLLARGSEPEPLPASPVAEPQRVLPINLDTVLRMADGQNLQIAVARERVREAYADRGLADLAWLPSFQVGTAYYRHEGGIQNQDGTLIQSSTGALFAGLEVYGRVDVREAIFRQVDAARKVWQQQGDLKRVTSEVLLEATTTYMDLLSARTAEATVQQLLHSEQEILDQARELADPSREPGTRFQVKAIEAEVLGLKQMHARLKQQGDAAAAKIAYLLRLGPDVCLAPVDGRLVPVDLVDARLPVEQLVARSLEHGPGVRELQQLLVVLHEGREQATGASRFLPILEMRMLEGGFGAGPGSTLGWENRWDLGVQARWNLTDLLRAEALEESANARLNQLHLTYQDVRAKLTLGVQEAREASLSGREQIRLAEDAVRQADEGYKLSNERLKENIPGSSSAEVLQFLRALQMAHLNYLNVINAYNKAQLRLLVLTGCAMAGAQEGGEAAPVDSAPGPQTTP